MVVYHWTGGLDTHAYVYWLDEDYGEQDSGFGFRRLAPEWREPTLLICDQPDMSHMPVGDCPPTVSGRIVLSRRAQAALDDLLAPHVEYLPLRCHFGGEFVAVNVLRVVDCIDRAKSAVRFFPSGRVNWIDKFVFRESAIGDTSVFRIPELQRTIVFATDRLVARVKEAGLEGFLFREKWRSR